MQAFYAYMFSYRGCVIDLTRPAQAYKNIGFRHFFLLIIVGFKPWKPRQNTRLGWDATCPISGRQIFVSFVDLYKNIKMSRCSLSKLNPVIVTRLCVFRHTYVLLEISSFQFDYWPLSCLSWTINWCNRPQKVSLIRSPWSMFWHKQLSKCG